MFIFFSNQNSIFYLVYKPKNKLSKHLANLDPVFHSTINNVIHLKINTIQYHLVLF